MKPKSWDRKLWGVAIGDMLLSSLNSGVHPQTHYVGEPRRALLFCTRLECRAWIKAQPCGRFTYRPVRVRERVEVCDASQ